jgi:drug/metabolite transporter (DMT)-like permease
LNRSALLLALTSVLWSAGGFLIKLINWNPLAIAGFRSAIACVLMLFFLPKARSAIRLSIVPGAIAYAGTVIFFVLATKLTTAANAIFLQYTAPIYIALLGPMVLGEKTRPRDWLFILVALGGVALFFLDRLHWDSFLGIVFALASGVSFALLILAMRRERSGSPESIVLLGNAFAFVIALPAMFSRTAIEQNWFWLTVLGVFQLTLPYLIYSAAIRHVRAIDAALIGFIEPILNPIWVLLITHEQASGWAILGGAIVLGTALARVVLASPEPDPIVSV